MRKAWLLGILAPSALVLGCSGNDTHGSTQGLGGGGQGGQGTGAATSSGGAPATSSTGAGATGGFMVPDGGATGGGGQALIYAHDDTTLVELDPTSPTLDVTTIGTFDCIDPTGQNGDTSMNDIAVDADKNLYGISAHDVHPLTIQGTTVHCGTQIPLANTNTRFYALTFAPKGVLDPAKEVLVGGNSAGELWKIDASGQLELHGKFGPVPSNDGHGHNYPSGNVGKDWELSGDIVFLANAGQPVGFATVRDCPNPPSTTGCSSLNTLIEIDMTKLAQAGSQIVTLAVRGQITHAASCADGLSDYGNLYGIAAWDAHVYGFSRLGYLVDVNIDDGTACMVHDYPNLKFAGAGVTTIAPITPPPH
jgi:hypothetical protein